MELENFRGWMKGEDCLVVGCGPSAMDALNVAGYRNYWTFGCNRMIPECHADFAVCVEPPRDKEMWKIVDDANPLFAFTHLPGGRCSNGRSIEFSSKDVRLWLVPGTEFDRDLRIRLGQCPFFAAAIAVLMGFRTIGLIGVDYTPDRYPDVQPSNVGWQRLGILAAGLGSRLVNLSPESRLETVVKEPWSAIRTK